MKKIFPIIVIFLIAVAGWVLWQTQQNTPPTLIPVNECGVVADSQVPISNWKFQQDPDNIGLENGWQSVNFNDSGWDNSAPGQPWEWVGYEDYDGVGWYRATFLALDSWEKAYLGSPPADDAGRIWVNGQEVAHEDLLEIPTGEPVTVAFRVDDFGGFGIRRCIARLLPLREKHCLFQGKYVAHGSEDWWSLLAC